jgi:hypothetical protein
VSTPEQNCTLQIARLAEAQAALSQLEPGQASGDQPRKGDLLAEAHRAVISAGQAKGRYSTKRLSLQRRLSILRCTLVGPVPAFAAALEPMDHRVTDLESRAAEVEAKGPYPCEPGGGRAT